MKDAGLYVINWQEEKFDNVEITDCTESKNMASLFC